MKQQVLKIKTIKAFLMVFVLTGLCTFECKAHTFIVNQTNESEPSGMLGIVFSKPFNMKGSKLGINYNLYHKDFDYTYSVNKAYSLGLTFSHHFNGNSYIRHISQSIEFNYTPYRLTSWPYSTILSTIGISCQTRHYNFETITLSPQIKLLPPMANLYFQYNITLLNNTKMIITPFEIGIELNTNLPAMLLGWNLNGISSGFF